MLKLLYTNIVHADGHLHSPCLYTFTKSMPMNVTHDWNGIKKASLTDLKNWGRLQQLFPSLKRKLIVDAKFKFKLYLALFMKNP